MSPWETLLERPAARGHLLQLCDIDGHTVTNNVSQYVRNGLNRGDGVLVVATAERQDAVRARLNELKADVPAAIESGQLVFLDAKKTLAQFMVDGHPDWDRFESVIGAVMRKVRPAYERAELRAYGEMVGVLWNNRQFSAAIRLEQFWNKLLSRASFTLFCAYSLDVFGKEFEPAALDALLCAHSHLIPGETNRTLELALSRATAEVLGPEAERIMQCVKTGYHPSWAVMPAGEAAVMWLRENLPGSADAILARAREHCQSVTALAD